MIYLLYGRIKSWQRNRKYTRHLSTDLLRRVTVLLLMLLILVTINSSVMIVAEKMAPGDAFWLSATTVTTVGYGDLSPSTAIGRFSTVVCMYLFAITVLTQLIGEVMDWRALRDNKKRMGEWEWSDMQNHIQIINTPNQDTGTYLLRLVSQIRSTPALKERPIQLLTRKYPEGLPVSLTALKLLHRTGQGENNEMLKSVNVAAADYIIILARDSVDTLSDSITFDILSRIQDIGTRAMIVAEAVDDENRNRFLAAGAHVVLRPVRAYPELLVRALIHPGTETVMEDLFRHEGVHIARVDVPFSNLQWSDLVCRFVTQGAGTPVGYIDEAGKAICNVDGSLRVSGKGVICLVSDELDISPARLLQVVAA